MREYEAEAEMLRLRWGALLWPRKCVARIENEGMRLAFERLQRALGCACVWVIRSFSG